MIQLPSHLDMTRRPTGFKDRDGTAIFIGDIVEFYCGETFLGSNFYIYDKEPGESNLTRTRDVVIEDGGEIYFLCHLGRGHLAGCRAGLAAGVCKVIGRDLALIE